MSFRASIEWRLRSGNLDSKEMSWTFASGAMGALVAVHRERRTERPVMNSASEDIGAVKIRGVRLILLAAGFEPDVDSSEEWPRILDVVERGRGSGGRVRGVEEGEGDGLGG